MTFYEGRSKNKRTNFPLYFIFRQNVIFQHCYLYRNIFFIQCVKLIRMFSKGAHLIKFQIRMDYSHGTRTLISTVTSKRYELSTEGNFFFTATACQNTPLCITYKV